MLARAFALALLALAVATVPGATVRRNVAASTSELPPAGLVRDEILRVTLHAKAGGAPVPHGRVRVFGIDNDRVYPSASAESDGAGVAILRELSRGASWLVVDADGFARASRQLVVGNDPASQDLALEPGATLDISVVDELGAPVEGAEVEVGSGAPVPVGARVDGLGHAQVRGVAPGGHRVSARAPGFEEVVRAKASTNEPLRLVLKKLGALLVHVADATGKPAPLAHVLVAGNELWPPRTTTTTASGNVRIGGLSAGSYALRAVSGASLSPIELGVALGRGEVRQVDLTLAPGAFVTARVLDGDDDDAPPVPNARVSMAEGGLSPFPLEATSDAAGVVRLGPFGSGGVLVSAQAEGFVQPRPVEVPDGTPSTVVRLVRAGELEGRVVDASGRPVGGAAIEIVGTTLSGTPIEDDPRRDGFRRAEFDATLLGPRSLIPAGELGVVPGPVPRIPRSAAASWAPTPTSPANAERWATRDDGTFRASPASPGRVRAYVHHPEFLEGVSEEVTLLPGGRAEVRVVLRRGGSLEGRVTDTRGRPVADAAVTIAAATGRSERQTRTASDGTFAFAAVDEDVVVTASAGDEDTGRTARDALLVPEGAREQVVLVLPDARGTLDVHVEDARGYPVNAAQVSVGSIDPSLPFRSTVFSDPHGDAAVRSGAGIPLRAEVSAPGFATRLMTVQPNSPSLRVELEPARTVVGEAHDDRSGQPLQAAEVALFSASGIQRTLTSAKGRYRFADVPVGRAKLRLRAVGHATVWRQLEVEARAQTDFEVPVINAREEASVEGVVVDEEGRPLVGARVASDHVPTYVPLGGHDPSYVVTDLRGRFRLGGLEDGVVALEAYAPDVGRARVEGIAVASGRTTTAVTLTLPSDRKERSAGPLAGGGVAVTLGELSGEPREVVLVAVAELSEAERAGLAAGDVLESVDGHPVHSISQARARLAGPLSNDVIVVRRRGDTSETLRIARERVSR